MNLVLGNIIESLFSFFPGKIIKTFFQADTTKRQIVRLQSRHNATKKERRKKGRRRWYILLFNFMLSKPKSLLQLKYVDFCFARCQPDDMNYEFMCWKNGKYIEVLNQQHQLRDMQIASCAALEKQHCKF